MKKVIILSALVLAVAIVSFGQEQEKKEAQAAAQEWLATVDNGDYAASWDTASTPFKAAVSKADWQRAISSSRGQFGKMNSRKLKNATYTTTLPGAPDGKYVVIQYETSFANKQSAVETITPMLDKDGKWHVSGYYIR